MHFVRCSARRSNRDQLRHLTKGLGGSGDDDDEECRVRLLPIFGFGLAAAFAVPSRPLPLALPLPFPLPLPHLDSGTTSAAAGGKRDGAGPAGQPSPASSSSVLPSAAFFLFLSFLSFLLSVSGRRGVRPATYSLQHPQREIGGVAGVSQATARVESSSYEPDS